MCHEPAVRALALELGRDRDAGGFERAPVALAPPVAGHEPEARIGAVADEGDPLVPELDQVARGERAAGHVVDPQARQPGMEGVEQDDAGAGPQERIDLAVARGERHDQQPVAAVERHAVAEVLVALRRVGDVADDDVVLRLVERGEHAAHALARPTGA